MAVAVVANLRPIQRLWGTLAAIRMAEMELLLQLVLLAVAMPLPQKVMAAVVVAAATIRLLPLALPVVYILGSIFKGV